MLMNTAMQGISIASDSLCSKGFFAAKPRKGCPQNEVIEFDTSQCVRLARKLM